MTAAARSLPRVPLWKLMLGGTTLALLAVLAWGLTRDPGYIPSQLVGRDAPDFTLPILGGEASLSKRQFLGKPLVVNFWASWCVSCRAEHKVLVGFGAEAGARDDVSIIGINYRDSESAATRFLDDLGHFPYRSAHDPRGRTGIDFGVYGLPETFFIDSKGIVVARHVGPLTPDALTRNLRLVGVAR